MQLKPAQLRNHLKQGIQPLYFVFGEEPLQVREAVDMLRKAAHYYGYAERQSFQAEANFNWELVRQAGSEISLFSEKKLLEVYLPSGKPGDKGAKFLITWAGQPAEETILLVYTHQAAKGIKNTKWYKTLLRQAVVVQTFTLQGQSLYTWLTLRLQAQGLACDNNGLDLIAAYTQGNMLAADQEIIKLGLLFARTKAQLPDNTDIQASHLSQSTQQHNADLRFLTHKELEENLAFQAHYQGFDLFDTMLQGNYRQLGRMMDQFQQQGVALIWLISIVSKEFHLLADLSTQLKHSDQDAQALSNLIQQSTIFPRRKLLIQTVLSRHQAIDWKKQLLQMAIIDRISKGVEKGDAWFELQQLMTHVALQISGQPE